MNLDPRSRWDFLITPALVCVVLSALFFVVAAVVPWIEQFNDATIHWLCVVTAWASLVTCAVMAVVIARAWWQDWREARERRQREARRLFIDERAFAPEDRR